MSYDPEAIYQDADIEMMEMAEAADKQYAACKRGEHGKYEYRSQGQAWCSFCGRKIDG